MIVRALDDDNAKLEQPAGYVDNLERCHRFRWLARRCHPFRRLASRRHDPLPPVPPPPTAGPG